MKIVIVTALPPEFNVARNELGLKEVTTKKDEPRIAEKDHMILVLTGMGREKAYKNLKEVLDLKQVDMVLDTGTCGSLVDELKIGDIVYSREVLDISTDLKLQGRVIGENNLIGDIFESFTVKESVIASVDRNITEVKHREILKDLGAQVVSWETIGVFDISREYNIPYLSIRGITDACNGETFEDFKRNRLEVCKKLYNSVKLLCKGI